MKRNNSRLFGLTLAVSTFLSLTLGQNNTQICPQLTCDPKISKLDERTCFQLSGTGPIKYIYGKPCYDPETAKPSEIPNVCPFNLQDG